MVIESLNTNQTRALRGDDDEASWRPYQVVFRTAFERLAGAGAEPGFIASNTPHMRLAGITRGLALPVVSILDSTAAAAHRPGAERALVPDTSVTMRSGVHARALHRVGVAALPAPDDDSIATLDRLIDEALCGGAVADARTRLLALCASRVERDGSDVVCLACAELPLAFPGHADPATFVIDGIAFVNTTVAHVDAVLAAAPV